MWLPGPAEQRGGGGSRTQPGVALLRHVWPPFLGTRGLAAPTHPSAPTRVPSAGLISPCHSAPQPKWCPLWSPRHMGSSFPTPDPDSPSSGMVMGSRKLEGEIPQEAGRGWRGRGSHPGEGFSSCRKERGEVRGSGAAWVVVVQDPRGEGCGPILTSWELVCPTTWVSPLSRCYLKRQWHRNLGGGQRMSQGKFNSQLACWCYSGETMDSLAPQPPATFAKHCLPATLFPAHSLSSSSSHPPGTKGRLGPPDDVFEARKERLGAGT